MKKWVALALALNLFVAYYGLARTVPDAAARNGPLDAALKAQIIRETPGLRAQLRAENTYAAARLILHWAAPRIPSAATSAQMLQTSPLSAGEIWFRHFRPLRDGVWCGGAADFYKKTLSLFGIHSAVVDFGRQDVLTHVTAFVKGPDHTSNPKWMMVSPTFGMELVSRATSKPVPFTDALLIAARGEANSHLRIRPVALAKRQIVYGPHRHAACATVRSGGMCGLRYLDRYDGLKANGYANGVEGLLALFNEGKIFSDTGAPTEILQAQRAAKRLIAESGEQVALQPPD